MHTRPHQEGQRFLQVSAQEKGMINMKGRKQIKKDNFYDPYNAKKTFKNEY